MSADAATLPCPICLHTGVFDSVQTLKDRLIYVSTNNIVCPVCQEEISGLDKLTIHLFSHVKLLTTKGSSSKVDLPHPEIKTGPKSGAQNKSTETKKSRSTASKNKTVPSTAATPVKFVKIYPKLPVIALNTLPVIDISRSTETCVQNGNNLYIPAVKAETPLVQPVNSKCNVCDLQFIDADILRMHNCLVHNIEEKSDHSFTRYNCHLCPKNFKMRGSLMVHLRVAHYGFSSKNNLDSVNSEINNKGDTKNVEDIQIIYDKNDGKQWQCDVCRKCFTTKYFLKKHKRLHTGETPYACTQCNKTFTFQQSYHKHLLYHNDEKPHTCSFCGRAFKELSTLHNHQRIHTGEKPFSCETCGKCFRQRVSYLVHRRIHTGAMPYKCTACEKSFRYKVSQRTHKCQAQPPGTVIRQTCDLVEKLKKKHTDIVITPDNVGNSIQNIRYTDVSEASAELVLSGAKLSLEDMESDNFKIIDDVFNVNNDANFSTPTFTGDVTNEITEKKSNDALEANIEELIDYIQENEKNIPSPSEIFKNLCLSKEDDLFGP